MRTQPDGFDEILRAVLGFISAREFFELFERARGHAHLGVTRDELLVNFRGDIIRRHRAQHFEGLVISVHTDVNSRKGVEDVRILGLEFEVFPRGLDVIDISLFAEQLGQGQSILATGAVDIAVFEDPLGVSRASLDIFAVHANHGLQDATVRSRIGLGFGALKTFFQLKDGFVRQAQGTVNFGHIHGDVVGIRLAFLCLFQDGQSLLIRPLVAIILEHLEVSLGRILIFAETFITRREKQ